MWWTGKGHVPCLTAFLHDAVALHESDQNTTVVSRYCTSAVCQIEVFSPKCVSDMHSRPIITY